MRWTERVIHTIPVVTVLAGVGCLAACDVGAPGARSVTTDSAGVMIVESLVSEWVEGAEWRVNPAPVVDLAVSGTGPAHEFFRVADATLRPDGSIVVLDAGSHEVRLYSAVGRHVGSTGREGEGPGEFERPRSLDQYRGDSLAVFDYWGRRITVLDASGRFVRSVPLTVPFLQEMHTLGDGGFIVSLNSLDVVSESVGRTRIPSVLVRLSPDGATLDTIAVVPGFEEWVFAEGSGQPPLGRLGALAVHGENVFTADGEGVRVEVRNLSGVLQQVIRVGDPYLVVEPSVRDSIRSFLLMPQPEMPEWYTDVRRDMAEDIPSTYPGVTDILVDPDGNVWLAAYWPRGVSEHPREWRVFDEHGAWLGAVTMPENFDAFEVGLGYVLGRKMNDLGVESVQLLALSRD